MKKLFLSLFVCSCAAVIMLTSGCAYTIGTCGKEYDKISVAHSKPLYLQKVSLNILGKDVNGKKLKKNLLEQYSDVFTSKASKGIAADLSVVVADDLTQPVDALGIAAFYACQVTVSVGDLQSTRKFDITLLKSHDSRDLLEEAVMDEKVQKILADCAAEFSDAMLTEADLHRPKMIP